MSPLDPQRSRWFAEEVLPHEAALRGWLRARFPAVSDADDLVQDAYVRLIRAHATGPVASVRAFLFITARNLALNRLRHQRIERPDGAAEIDAFAVPDEQAGIPESLVHAEDFQLLIRAIQSLPERCRQVITLRKIYGFSQREVAERLGISEHTVEAQGSIGVRKCLEFFRRHGHGRKSPMNPDTSKLRSRDGIALSASHWVLRRDRGLTAAEQDELSLWLAADPRHGEALGEHHWGWDELDRLAGLQMSSSAPPDPDLLAPRTNSRSVALLRLVWIVPVTVAAAAAIILALRPRELAPVIAAAVVPGMPAASPEWRVLEDGSRVELDSGAEIEVTFDAARRHVRLLGGEATFTVRRDPARPFVVTAGEVEVRAVGTVFSVRLDFPTVKILVLEGRVAVQSKANADALLLAAGQSAIVPRTGSASPQVRTLTASQLASRLTGHPVDLIFTDAPLADVVAAFNRCNEVQLVIGDPEIARMRISGKVRSDNVNGFLRLLEATVDVTAERRSEREVVIRRKN